MRENCPVASLPLDDLSLWEIYYKASYYDNDPSMPGMVPVDIRFFVLAKNQSEALQKTKKSIQKTKKDHHKESEISANVVSLENLIPARNSSNDGRLGWQSNTKLKEIELSLKEDQKRFRLGVCLIPVEE